MRLSSAKLLKLTKVFILFHTLNTSLLISMIKFPQTKDRPMGKTVPFYKEITSWTKLIGIRTLSAQ